MAARGAVSDGGIIDKKICWVLTTARRWEAVDREQCALAPRTNSAKAGEAPGWYHPKKEHDKSPNSITTLPGRTGTLRKRL